MAGFNTTDFQRSETTSWHSQPNERGTWQILLTCLITINLCVWTAVHLNIPAPAPQPDLRSRRQRVWTSCFCRRARWVLLGIFAPELVVYTAWMQWEAARLFVRRVNQDKKRKAEQGQGLANGTPGQDAETAEKSGRSVSNSGTAGAMGDEESLLSHRLRNVELDKALYEQKGPKSAAVIVTEGPSSPAAEISSGGDDDKAVLHDLSMIQGFYAGMGGYHINVKDYDGSNTTRHKSKTYFLTATGLVTYIEESEFRFDLSSESITDRSKSDLLAKSLVCLQAAYMIVQCVTRLVSKLPLTVLEVNTLGHVLCALVMYSFWFNKPQDIRQSVQIRGDLAKRIQSYTYAHYEALKDDVNWSTIEELYKRIWSFREAYLPFRLSTSASSQSNSEPDNLPATRRRSVGGANTSVSTPQTPLPPFRGAVKMCHPTKADVKAWSAADLVLVLKYVDRAMHADRELFKAQLEAQLQNSRAWSEFSMVYCGFDSDWSVDNKFQSTLHKLHKHGQCLVLNWSAFDLHRPLIERLLIQRIKPISFKSSYIEDEPHNWPHGAGLLMDQTFLPPLAIAFATAIYGGLHAAAWNSFFSTTVEKWFWRASSVIIAASGCYVLFGVAIHKVWEKIFYYKFREFPGRLHSLAMDVLSCIRIDLKRLHNIEKNRIRITILGTIAALCVVSRVFLVVEAFISLRAEPVTVYQTPDWTQWIPHL